MMLLSFLVVCLVGSSLSSVLPQKRIVNGEPAEFAEFPYIVSMRRELNGRHICGASIISPEWILVAAHCVYNKVMPQLNIQYGVTDISETGPNIVNAKNFIVHGGYNPVEHINDIALIQLEEPLNFDKFTQAIKLPKQGYQTPVGSTARLIGWGRNATEGWDMDHLQKVDLKIISDKECKDRYFGRTFPSNICASTPMGGQCNGDSGGPLTVDDVQVGLVSWSKKPCGTYPGVFTEISVYSKWIQEQTGIQI